MSPAEVATVTTRLPFILTERAVVSDYVAFRSGRRDAFPSADLSIDG